MMMQMRMQMQKQKQKQKQNAGADAGAYRGGGERYLKVTLLNTTYGVLRTGLVYITGQGKAAPSSPYSTATA